MKYYKLVLDNTIIGAITSDNFVRYSSVAQQFVTADEMTGEYIDYKGILYRSPWLRPITIHKDFVSVVVMEITEDEYETFRKAISNNEKVYDDLKTEKIEVVEFKNPIEAASIDFIRTSKINEMSHACQKAIENGFDLELRGTTYHFSLTIQDQLNLAELQLMAQTHDLIPYHADGEEVKYYAPKEIELITTAATQYKIYQTTYFNSLKTYINSLETIEEISAITYGVEIPEEYQSIVLKNL